LSLVPSMRDAALDEKRRRGHMGEHKQAKKKTWVIKATKGRGKS